ncbi:calmodulin-binding transcription activator 1-like isoform X2 [Artemia franciscana]|uniref:CG-1 domain-containing protein n=1 Tax=Artemia franciscana TaxID=6661 RepID=A0AA88HT43_ARTSF|nr:hypothetical protein QYM36_013885 [Artemia franciscana]KAK2710392.1 hypothetical protein QYM36_013885 [Artemia franciscana]
MDREKADESRNDVSADEEKEFEEPNNDSEENNDGETGITAKIVLPESLESLPRAENLPLNRHRWNSNEEIAAVLINFERHCDWLSKEVKIRPKSGSMHLYSRKKVRYRRDGYCWKKRKDGKTTREDHMKLKVQGTECIYGCYVHSAILPTFHRRCYWLLQNPDIVLVHYLNVPYPDDSKLVVVSSVALWGEHKEWTKEELIMQLKPMFFNEEEPSRGSELEVSTSETVESIVSQLLEKQRTARSCSVSSSASPCSAQNKARDLLSADTTWSSEDKKQVLRKASSGNFQKMEQKARNIPESGETLVSSTTGCRATGQRATKQDNIKSSRAFSDNTGQSTQFLFNLSNLHSGTGLLIFKGNNGLNSESEKETENLDRQELKTLSELHYRQRETLPRLQYSEVIKSEVQNSLNQNSEELNRSNDTSHLQACQLNINRHTYGCEYDTMNSPMKTEEFDALTSLTAEDVQRTLNSSYTTFSPFTNLMVNDDILVNIDPLDVLSDFDLDSVNCDLKQVETKFDVRKPNDTQCSDATTNVYITDYSPEWAPTEGGCKVLVAGPWLKTDSSYAIMIDGQSLATTVVQPGVLRCYTMPHRSGTVTLQVTCDSEVISNTLAFEFREVRISPLVPSEMQYQPTATLHHHPDLMISRSPTKTPEAAVENNSFILDCSQYSSMTNDLSSETEVQSHESGKFFKRSSLDSVSPASNTSADKWKRPFDNRVPKLTRNDRSLSLPVSSLPSSPCGNSLSVPSPLVGVRSSSPKDADKTHQSLQISPYSSQSTSQNRRESVSSCDFNLVQLTGEQDSRVLTLAEQIIAAIPDRIKMEMDDMSNDSGYGLSVENPMSNSNEGCSTRSESTIESMNDSALFDPLDYTFEFSDHSYRYCDPGTPNSSLSPGSSSCLQSPCSYSMGSPSPPPTTADFTEFFQASNSIFINDFSNLTLSDREQKELYEAAKMIQKAYRSYKGRKKAEEQDREKQAASLIQNYYRRYKQYVYAKQMNRAAAVIQNQFRSYYETKRFKKQEGELCLPPPSHPYYRQCRDVSINGRQSREGTPSSGLKRTYSQRRQHQAARKIQQFMRQSKNKLQRERALAAQSMKQSEGAYSSHLLPGMPSSSKKQ